MKNAGKVGEICALVAIPLAVFALISQLAPISKIYPDLITNPNILLASYVAIYLAIIAIVAMTIALVWQAITVVRFKRNAAQISARLSDSSEAKAGGVLFIEGTYSGSFSRGYIETQFSLPNGLQKRQLIGFNQATGLGEMRGDKTPQPFSVKWEIPTDSGYGDSQIIVRLFDLLDVETFRTTKFTRMLAEMTLSTVIAKRGAVEIEKLVPADRGLRAFNPNSLPMWGWVCVKVDNNTDAEYKSCTGQIRTDAGIFPLYDYDRLKASETNSTPSSFTIEPNSVKLVCANIISRTPRGKILLDLDDVKLARELDVEAS